MDWRVYPDTPISRLPLGLRHLALFVRNLTQPLQRARLMRRQARLERRVRIEAPPSQAYVYEADGIATRHFSPFLTDRAWAQRYDEMASTWFVGMKADARWRMWLLTSLARQCERLPGNFAEFGVYRGGCALMILGTTEPPPSNRFYLFDTFEGIPENRLTPKEEDEGLGGRLADTSREYVQQLLKDWQERLVFCPGDVFDTLKTADTGPLSFVHMDLNASAPTQQALEYAYPRLVAGAAVVFDDYGWTGLEEQRRVIDDFFDLTPEDVIAFPTGQGLVIKLP